MTTGAGPAAHDDTGDRAAIRSELGATLFVEAGAGTGKTTALVGRICELVLTGRARLGEVAAITFTEAAAGELRDRVAEELERAALGAPSRTGEENRRRPEERQRAAAAVADLDGAAIGTLHGFARRILAAHPLEAGMPPWIEVYDEVRSVVAFEERWHGFVERLLSDGDLAEPVLRAMACGVDVDALRAIAIQLNDNWDLLAPLPRGHAPPPAIDVEAVLAPARRAVAMAGRCSDPGDRLLAHLATVADTVGRLAASQDPMLALELLAGRDRRRLRLGSTVGRAANWDRCIEEVRDHLQEAEAARTRLVERVGVDALTRLAAAIGAMTLEAADRRRAEGRVEFHDLLVLSRDLLRRRPDVAAALGATWRYLLIDEFQDTDPIQIELAARIAAGGAPAGTEPGPGRWQDLDLAPGRLFFVGDPKQSIYRFRRADITQFMEARERFCTRRLRLSTNRRSVPGILAWVNEVFGSLMGAGIPGEQPPYEALGPYREAHRSPGPGPAEGAAPVVLVGGPHAGASSEDVREIEAADVARAVRAVAEEGWPVAGPGGKVVAARYADVAVLLPSRTSLDALLGGLEDAGIPYRLEGTSLVYAMPEVRDLLTVLAAIDDPTDEVAVVAALRTPYLGCGDDDLVRHAAAGGRWDYRRDPEPPGDDPPGPVADAGAGGAVRRGLGLLRRLHGDRWWREPSSLVGEVVASCRALEVALDSPRPREAWRCLRFVEDQARQFTDAGGGDLRRYLAWVEHQRRDDVRVTEVTLPEDDLDAVRVMTVHAAKGLEFPVVVMAGLGTQARRDSGPRVLFGPAGLEVTAAGIRTPGFAAADEQAQRLDDAERIRLLYVAATRARDHLVVSVHRVEGTECAAGLLADAGAGAWCRRLGDAAAASAPAVQPPLPGLDPGAGPPPTGGAVAAPAATADPADDPGTLARWEQGRAALLAAAAEPRAVSATAMAKLAGTDPAEEPVDRPPWRRGRAGTAVGRAVHAVLQAIDLATGDGLAARAAAAASAEGVAERAGEVARLVAAALEAAPVRAAVDGGRYWRELYLACPVGGRVVEGFVDLLVDGPAGLEVVDYKTDQAAEDEDLDRAVARYRLQGAAYALAAGAVLGRPVASCAFVFLRADGARVRRVADLAGAVAEVEAALSA